MHYRNLGKSSLKVSALCLGTMMFGDQAALAEAVSIVADARLHGINSIDTADVYSKGGLETMVGQLIKGRRQHWVLANPVVGSVIAGPRTLTQRQDDLSRARLRFHARGLSAGGRPGQARPSVHAGLYRPGLSAHWSGVAELKPRTC